MEGEKAMVRTATRVLVLCSIGLSVFAQSTIAGRRVSVTVINREDLSAAKWQGADPVISSVKVVTTADDTIYSLLQANGIYPDSEAFTLVYDLNPTLNTLALSDGIDLQLPKVAAESDLARLKAGDDLARVAVDADLRDALSKSAGQLQSLVNSSAGLTGTAAQSQLKSIAAAYAQIDKSYHRRTGPPLRREALRQLLDEAAALNTILEDAEQTKKKLSGDDESQIAAIHDDLSGVMANYSQILGNNPPKAEETCAVLVNIKGENLAQSDTMRVYYTFNGLYRDPPSDPPVRSSSWTQLGSGHSGRLLSDKNYKVWAARDGDPGHPLTAPFRLETTCENNQTIVDLSLITKVN
jgi:hypothetical protein